MQSKFTMSLIPKLTNKSTNLDSLSVFLPVERDRSLMLAPTSQSSPSTSIDRKLQVFASTIHEMRNLINSIVGLTELLSTTDLDREQLDYLESLKLNEGYLLTLLNDLLDYSQLKSGEQTLKLQEFNLHFFFKNAIDSLKFSAQNKQLNLKLFFDKNLPQQVRGDAKVLQQILLNLIGNAIKFTNCGEIIVKVSPISLKNNSNTIVLKIEVKDEGIGIEARELNKIFNPFFQVDRCNNSQDDRGVGLGLAISQELVTLMKGKIGVESKLGCGSNFWFTVELELV